MERGTKVRVLTPTIIHDFGMIEVGTIEVALSGAIEYWFIYGDFKFKLLKEKIDWLFENGYWELALCNICGEISDTSTCDECYSNQ